MSRTAVVIALVSLVALIRQAGAQPAPKESPRAEAATPDDDPQFRCKNQVGEVVVTLKAETDVKELIAWVMSFTCRNFMLDPRVVATGRKVSIITPNKMTTAEAYQVFLAALATINLTVVQRGSVLRVVEAPAARREALRLMRKGTPDDVEQIVRYIYKPSYVAAESLHQACLAMKSDAGDVLAVGALLVITDYGSHVREMLSFARLVDVPGGNDGIYTLPVRHADANKLMEKLNGILNISSGAPPRPAAPDPGKPDGKLATAAAPSKLVVDERTNTLIIASSEAGYQRVKALVDRLDIALEIEGGSSIHVYPLGSAVAEELAKTLTATISDGRGAKPAGGPPSTTPAPAPGGTTAPGPVAAGAPTDGLSPTLEGQVRVIPDPPTNSLIVMSSGRDFLAIREVIRQLDLPRRQVYIEVLILEVDAGNDSALGTTFHGGQPRDNGSVLYGGVKTGDVNTLKILDSVQSATGLFGGVIGSSMTLLGQSIPSYAVLFQAVAERTNANIISAPSIIAVDNVEAKYKVGTKIPVNKGTVLTPFGGTAAAQPSIELTEFPLKLDIKPHISNDDMVLLEVKHDADQLTAETARGPRSSTRSFETRVVVHDQETIVLGGLTQERDSSTTSQVPLLGDVPILGYLFKTVTRTKRKTNLLILLTPHILKDRRDLERIRQHKIREHDEFARSFSTLEHMAYEPRIDYGRKRGLVEEINRAVQAAEEDASARAAVPRARPVETGSVEVAAPAP
jgi:general secretion pathway protein D